MMRPAIKHNDISSLSRENRSRPQRTRRARNGHSLRPVALKVGNDNVAAVTRGPSTHFRRFRAAWTWFVRTNAARREAQQLRSLPNHMLRDIGLSRCGIERAVRFGNLERHGAASDAN